LFLSPTQTVSKPLGKLFAKHASEYPRIRNVCAEGAQIYHRINVAFGPGNIRYRDVRPLETSAAVQLGCEMVSEMCIFGICFAFLYYGANTNVPTT
jgi:hypothetical protein